MSKLNEYKRKEMKKIIFALCISVAALMAAPTGTANANTMGVKACCAKAIAQCTGKSDCQCPHCVKTQCTGKSDCQCPHCAQKKEAMACTGQSDCQCPHCTKTQCTGKSDCQCPHCAKTKGLNKSGPACKHCNK